MSTLTTLARLMPIANQGGKPWLKSLVRYGEKQTPQALARQAGVFLLFPFRARPYGFES